MQLLFIKRSRLGLVVGVALAVVLLLMWNANWFRTAQQRLTNIYFVPRDTSDTITIVALDDDSLQRYGRTPSLWSRDVYAELIAQLVASGARVVAFDLLFSEASDDPNADQAFQEALLAARQSETRTRFVFASAGVSRGTTASDDNSLLYDNGLYPIDPLREQTDALGMVNIVPDVDGSVRRQPSRIMIDDTQYLSFSLATYLTYLRIPAMAFEQVITSDDEGLRYNPARPEYQLPIDALGIWRQNFYGAPSDSGRDETFPIVSFADVVDGEVDSALFADKIVLVGLMTVAGDADRYAVPIAQSTMAGVEIHANAVETLIQNAALVTPAQLTQGLLIAALAIVASLLYAYPRWYFKLGLALVLVIGYLLVALTIFNTQLLVMPLLYPLLAIILPAPLMTGLDASRELSLRRHSDFLLRSLVEIAEQRLQIDAILPLIANDVQRILPGSQGAIYIQQGERASLTTGYTWGEADSDSLAHHNMVMKVQEQAQPQVVDNVAGLPIWWQGHLQAIVVVEHSQVAARIRLLQDFADRLAPNFDNAYLFNEVQEQQNTLATVIGSTPSAVIVLDDLYRVRLLNDEANRIFGEDDDIIGKSLVVLLSQVGIEDMEQAQLMTKLQDEQAFTDDFKVGNSSYKIDAAPIPAMEQWVLVLSDVSELIELSNLKTRMLRMASHDLKNPLGRINGYAQLIEMRMTDNEKAKKYLNYITDAVDEMNTLIMDILDLERMRSGRMETQRFSFRDSVTSVLSRHEGDAQQKSQTFTVDVTGEALIIDGDARQLSQVVSNLVGNAIKYTPNGGDIGVKLWREGWTAHFEVQDNGYGISDDAQQKLFTEFYRVRTEQTAQISGTGLGLSLVKQVVDAHMGDVGVESTEGEGSRFWVTLPLAKDSESNVIKEPTSESKNE